LQVRLLVTALRALDTALGQDAPDLLRMVDGLPDGAGHFPFHTDPVRFVATIEQFLATTRPAVWDPEQWRQLLLAGAVTELYPEAPADERNAT
jgi:hypothetical protein